MLMKWDIICIHNEQSVKANTHEMHQMHEIFKISWLWWFERNALRCFINRKRMHLFTYSADKGKELLYTQAIQHLSSFCFSLLLVRFSFFKNNIKHQIWCRKDWILSIHVSVVSHLWHSRYNFCTDNLYGNL